MAIMAFIAVLLILAFAAFKMREALSFMVGGGIALAFITFAAPQIHVLGG